MRTRKQDYLDMATHTGKYGIDVWNPDTHCWNGVAENGKPLLYDAPAERDAVFERMRTRSFIPAEIRCIDARLRSV